MDFIVSVAFIAAWIWVWRCLAQKLNLSGRGWFVRHLAGSTVGFLAGVLIVSLAIAVGIISPEKKQVAEQVAEVVPSNDSAPVALLELKAPAVEEVKTLGFTPNEYADRLNKIFKSVDIKYRVKAKNIVKGEVNDVLNISIGKHAVLIARLSKEDGQVLDITILGAGDGSPASGLDIMMVASAGLAAAAPDVELKKVFQELPALLDGQDRTHGDVKLSAKQTDKIGTWFFASPI